MVQLSDSFKNSNPPNCIKTAHLLTRHVHTPEVQTTVVAVADADIRLQVMTPGRLLFRTSWTSW